MAATNKNWKYYVYRFMYGNDWAYIGKGSNARFNVQIKRFTEFTGEIIAYFISEQDALDYEKALIKQYAPSCNIAMNGGLASPWKYLMVPNDDKDFKTWIQVLGTKQMCARILLAKPWSVLKKYGIDTKALLSKVEGFEGVYHGQRY